jgi:hypothetical protein
LDFPAGTGTTIGDFFQPSTFFGQHGSTPARAESDFLRGRTGLQAKKSRKH